MNHPFMKHQLFGKLAIISQGSRPVSLRGAFPVLGEFPWGVPFSLVRISSRALQFIVISS
jgi:hypothetical protein